MTDAASVSKKDLRIFACIVAGGFTLEMNEDDPDYPALMLANNMLGGDLKSRLFARIREKDGLSYGVRSGFNASLRSKFAQFAVQAISAPEMVSAKRK